MFVTTREPGIRRRNRVYTSNKAARSSKISLLSAFTVATTSSGGSNSTITQDSYNKSQQKPRRRRLRDHRSRQSYEDNNGSVDVFDFLVGEEAKSKETLAIADDAEDTEGQESEFDTVNTEPEPIRHPDESDPEGYYRNLSDSGISMGSGSTSSGFPLRHDLPTLQEEPSGHPSPYPHTGTELTLADPRWIWPTSSPRPYRDGHIPPPCPPPPPAVIYDVPVYPYPPYTPYGTPPPIPNEDTRQPVITIREPANRGFKPPCFRSFSRLSARMILQMQDDIASLEEDIKLLDEDDDIAEESSQMKSPQSHHETQNRKAREEEVYKELHAKLDNYC